MKKISAILLAILALTGSVWGQTKAPALSIPSYVGSDIITNVAVALPVGMFSQGVVYSPARTLSAISMQAAWTPNAEADLTGYRFIFGDAKLGTTNTIDMPKNVTNVVFFALSTNVSYYFYVKATAVSGDSQPSAVALYQPSK